eukprot:137876-Hanusia_phi.AAC.1
MGRRPTGGPGTPDGRTPSPAGPRRTRGAPPRPGPITVGGSPVSLAAVPAAAGGRGTAAPPRPPGG